MRYAGLLGLRFARGRRGLRAVRRPREPEPVAAGAEEGVPAARTEPNGAARTDLVAVRRRGAGTDLAPNA